MQKKWLLPNIFESSTEEMINSAAIFGHTKNVVAAFVVGMELAILHSTKMAKNGYDTVRTSMYSTMYFTIFHATNLIINHDPHHEPPMIQSQDPHMNIAHLYAKGIYIYIYIYVYI